MQRTAEELARHVSFRGLNNSYASDLLQLLAKSGNDFINASPNAVDVRFYRAKRLVLAFQALISGDEPYYSQEVAKLNSDVISESSFDAEKLARDLESLRLKLEARQR